MRGVQSKDYPGRAKDALPGKSLVWVNHKSLDKLGSVSSKMKPLEYIFILFKDIRHLRSIIMISKDSIEI